MSTESFQYPTFCSPDHSHKRKFRNWDSVGEKTHGSLFSPWHQHLHHFLFKNQIYSFCETGTLPLRMASGCSSCIDSKYVIKLSFWLLASHKGETVVGKHLAGPWDARADGGWCLSLATCIGFPRGQENTEPCLEPWSWSFTETSFKHVSMAKT